MALFPVLGQSVSAPVDNLQPDRTDILHLTASSKKHLASVSNISSPTLIRPFKMWVSPALLAPWPPQGLAHVVLMVKGFW